MRLAKCSLLKVFHGCIIFVVREYLGYVTEKILIFEGDMIKRGMDILGS